MGYSTISQLSLYPITYCSKAGGRKPISTPVLTAAFTSALVLGSRTQSFAGGQSEVQVPANMRKQSLRKPRLASFILPLGEMTRHEMADQTLLKF